MDKNKLLEQFRGFFNAQLKSINGLMETLPESARADFEKLRTDLNAQLKTLDPLEQIPAALDASYAISSLSMMLQRISDYSTELGNRIASLTPRVSVAHALEGRIASKDLLTKDEVKGMVDEAMQKGRDAVMPFLLGSRRKLVEMAGLPAAADSVLGLPEKDFDAALAGAQKNVTTLKDKKRDGKLKEKCAWMNEKDFTAEMGVWDELIGNAGAGGGGGAGDKGNDPLRGGAGGGAGGAGTEKKKRFAF